MPITRISNPGTVAVANAAEEEGCWAGCWVEGCWAGCWADAQAVAVATEVQQNVNSRLTEVAE